MVEIDWAFIFAGVGFIGFGIEFAFRFVDQGIKYKKRHRESIWSKIKELCEKGENQEKEIGDIMLKLQEILDEYTEIDRIANTSRRGAKYFGAVGVFFLIAGFLWQVKPDIAKISLGIAVFAGLFAVDLLLSDLPELVSV
jgi:hypothetical protein